MTLALNFFPPIIAHRGASFYAPENTMIAFQKAVDLGIKWVEFDVMQAACGEAIIFHDDTLERTTLMSGNVSDYPYTYLQTLDAGSWFDKRFVNERIPTLDNVLDFLQENNLNANIEIKCLPQDEENLIKNVVKKVAAFSQKSSATILFSSFSVQALRYLRHYSPNCLLGLLLHNWEEGWEEIALSLNCVSVHVNEEIMTANYASRIKEMDKFLLCYTVNDPLRAKALYAMRVDAVFSDVPDKILAILDTH